MQNNIENLVRLDNKECLQTYTTKFQSLWGDALVVTSVNRNDTVIQIWDHDPGYNNVGFNYNDQAWVCSGRADDDFRPASCDFDAVIESAANWTIPDVAPCKWPRSGSCQSFDAPIEYCLATPTPSHCFIRMSPTLMYVVVACNIMKIICLVSTVLLSNFEPVATVGDAISSFIQLPDPTTSHTGFLSRKARGVAVESQSHRWFAAMGTARALLTLGA